jgi:hypothetical protein
LSDLLASQEGLCPIEWNSNLLKFEKKYRENYMTTLVRLFVSGDVNPPQRLRFATLRAFILLTVACDTTMHTECIVVFPLQGLLYERAEMLVHHTYNVCLVLQTSHLRCLSQTNEAKSAEKYQKEGNRAGKHGVMSLGPSVVFQLQYIREGTVFTTVQYQFVTQNCLLQSILRCVSD